MPNPKLLNTRYDYSLNRFGKDAIRGVIIGIVTLTLVIAFSIASGVTQEKGPFTDAIGGFIISAMGGIREQTGDSAGAFVAIVYGIVQEHGVNGLIIATFIACIMQVMMGLAGLGSAIKFKPYPLIVGFTSGIASLIFSSKIKGTLSFGDVYKFKETMHILDSALTY